MKDTNMNNEFFASRRFLLPMMVVMFCVGMLVQHTVFPASPESDINPDCIAHYPLLRPDLDCNSADKDYSHVEHIQTEVATYIEEEKAAGHITRASVFFRDLQSRRFAKINPEETYVSASLLKLPLAIAYYKLAEIDPTILAQEFQYQAAEDYNSVETWKPAVSLVPGKVYTVEEMIEHMITYSDNDTAVQLERGIDQQFFRKVLLDLGIILPQHTDNESDFLSPSAYGSIFRMLYLSSYLNIDHSQKLLQQLSRASFQEGLRKHIPTGIPVAHKFGERELIDEKTGGEISAQLHDCGIVYKPESPYILCVMTEGKDSKQLPHVVADIAQLVFEIE